MCKDAKIEQARPLTICQVQIRDELKVSKQVNKDHLQTNKHSKGNM
jgi:hypothetical protein